MSNKNKIETRVSFPTISSQPIYKNINYDKKNSNSSKLSKTLIDLPIWTMLTCKVLLGGLESNVKTSLIFKNQPEH